MALGDSAAYLARRTAYRVVELFELWELGALRAPHRRTMQSPFDAIAARRRDQSPRRGQTPFADAT
jgi:hypothetical protein